MVESAVLPLLVGGIRFRRRLPLIALTGVARRRAKRDSGTCVMRVKVEEIVGLRSDEVV